MWILFDDKYHTARYLNKGVDEVRKQEVHREDALKYQIPFPKEKGIS